MKRDMRPLSNEGDGVPSGANIVAFFEEYDI